MVAKYLKWEFWPATIFYLPIFFYFLFLCLKARSISFFVASNPSQYLGGIAKASKYKILKRFDETLIPKTILIEPNTEINSVETNLIQSTILFPLVAKPNIGERGKKVALVKDIIALKNYLTQVKGDLILQEFIDYPIELGIMYYRYPDQVKGNISSIVKKGFLQITGDGISTYLQLFEKGERTQYYLRHLKKKYSNQLNNVLPKNEILILEHIGNHVRGTTFYNANHLINDELIEVFDKISEQQEDFYFGRYDIKCKSIDSLYKGEGIKIMELNGANSEPAHIYDPKMSLVQAYKDLIKHWNVIYDISVMNHKRGFAYMPAWTAIKEVLDHNIKKPGTKARLNY